MPRNDKTYKPRKPIITKIGKEEKEALKSISSNLPKFPNTLDGLKKNRK